MNDDGDKCLKNYTMEVVRSGNGDNVRRGQGLVRATMKQITHTVTLRETKKDGQKHSCADV